MRLRYLAVLLLISLTVLAICQKPTEAKIRIGDELSVYVLDEKDLTTNVIVQSDGSAYIPRIGRLSVAGDTIDYAQRLLIAKLKKFIKDPVATLSLKTQKVQIAYVIGGTDGAIELAPGADIRKVYAQQELTKDADQYLVKLFRDGREVVALSGADLTNSQNPLGSTLVEGNDVVIIQPQPYVRVWIVGSVKFPGQQKVREGDDVYRALAQAGDIDLTTNSRPEAPPLRTDYRVSVRRGPDVIDVPTIPDAHATPMTLEDGDTIFVQPPAKIEVTLTGNLKNVGDMQFRAGTTLATALSQSGGPDSEGSLDHVVLFHNGIASVYDARLTKDPIHVLNTPVLESHDVIYVPRNEHAFYVFGQATKPGRYLMQDARKYRLSDAVAEAQGTNQNGSLRHVYLVHAGTDGKMTKAEYHLDDFVRSGIEAANPEVLPGDMIYIDSPRGITYNSVVQALSAALYVQAVTKI